MMTSTTSLPLATLQTFQIGQTIRHAIFADDFERSQELILFLENGDVMVLNTATHSQQRLFSVLNRAQVSYAGGDFDLANEVFMQALGDFIIIAEKYNCRYFLYQRSTQDLKRFARDDYYSEYSYFPLRLFNKNNVPHLAYSTQWNRVDVVNLASHEILTATKSLIGEDTKTMYAEQKMRGEKPDYFYPTSYDYFYGKILFSPNQHYFLSAGWAWGSVDELRLYDYADFIDNILIRSVEVFSGEHEQRAVCWLSDNTIAVAYNPLIEGEELAVDEQKIGKPEMDWLHIYGFEINAAIDNAKPDIQLLQKIPLGFRGLYKCELVYHPENQWFVAYGRDLGLRIFDKNGICQVDNPLKTISDVAIDKLLLLEIDGKRLQLHQATFGA